MFGRCGEAPGRIPETPAPGAAEDGYTAYRWISDNAADLGLDPARVGLAGQSGGGGIIVALRDRLLGTVST